MLTGNRGRHRERARGVEEAEEPAFFDLEQAPLNHAIFGPNPAFTGAMIAGEITISAPAVLPLIAGTPTP